MRKARQVVVNSLQLAHLNSMGSAWCMGTASGCLVSSPTSVQGMGEYWPDVWNFDEMVGDMGSGFACEKLPLSPWLVLGSSLFPSQPGHRCQNIKNTENMIQLIP